MVKESNICVESSAIMYTQGEENQNKIYTVYISMWQVLLGNKKEFNFS